MFITLITSFNISQDSATHWSAKSIMASYSYRSHVLGIEGPIV